MNDRPAASYDGTLAPTAEGGVIRFERHLPYAIADVWDAITNPERLAEWWLPFDADITVELRQGGQIVFAGRGDDAPTFTCTVIRVEAPRLLEHTHIDGTSYLRWELEAVDDGCVLRLNHFLTDTAKAIDGCWVVGLYTSLARLEPCLSRRPEPWDWERFAAAQAHYASLGIAAPPAAP